MDTNEKVMNKNTICRVCMQSGENDLIPISNKILSGDNITVADIITECTKYPVSQNDLLPVQICKLCMEAAHNAYQFKRQTEKTYRCLKALFDIKWVPKEENDNTCSEVCVDIIKTDKYTQTDTNSECKYERDSKECSSDENKYNPNLLHVRPYTGHLTKENRFKCSICSIAFSRRNLLCRHLKDAHHTTSERKSNAELCKEYRERQKVTKSPKLFQRQTAKSNAQKCKEYRERQKIKEDANSRSEKNSQRCKEYREKLRIKKDLENPKTKATLEEPEIENEDDDDIEISENPFASDEEHYSMKDEDVKRFVETITHPEIILKDETNDIIDEYSYDDMDMSIMEPEAILLESESDDEVKLVINTDCEPQYYHHEYNSKNTKSFSATHKYQQNSTKNMFRCIICHMEFKLRRILERHMLTHNDERPFSCHMCLKTFKRKDNLQKHIREVHHKNFACDMCFEKFGTYKRLIIHKQKNHHRTCTKNK